MLKAAGMRRQRAWRRQPAVDVVILDEADEIGKAVETGGATGMEEKANMEEADDNWCCC